MQKTAEKPSAVELLRTIARFIFSGSLPFSLLTLVLSHSAFAADSYSRSGTLPSVPAQKIPQQDTPSYPTQLQQIFRLFSQIMARTHLIEADRTATENLERRLIQAVESKDIVSAKQLLSQGANPNTVHQKMFRSPVLLTAMIKGDVEMVTLLLSHGADPNFRDAYGTPVLISAASLVTANPTSQQSSALMLRSIQVLLKNPKADVNIQDAANLGDDRTALHLASINGRSDLVALLLNSGAQVDSLNRYHETPLHFASERGWLNVAKLLLSRGANPNQITRFTKRTALMAAAETGKEQMMKLLIQYQARTDLVDAFGNTTIDLAAKSKAKKRSPAAHLKARAYKRI